ncbi:MAG: hypothetical protein E7614_08920 [Ruminococcaceae bacterium]|nr:hypothetical protein [Oscillospiraceae bacterium]
MALQVNIDNEKIDNFSSDAKAELVKQLEKYGDNIIKESNLIEEAIREDGASTEITSNIVIQAVRKSKFPNKKKHSKILLFLKIVSWASLLLTGFLFDSNGYEKATGKLIVFVICLIVACVSTVLQFVYEDKE